MAIWPQFAKVSGFTVYRYGPKPAQLLYWRLHSLIKFHSNLELEDA